MATLGTPHAALCGPGVAPWRLAVLLFGATGRPGMAHSQLGKKKGQKNLRPNFCIALRPYSETNERNIASETSIARVRENIFPVNADPDTALKP